MHVSCFKMGSTKNSILSRELPHLANGSGQGGGCDLNPAPQRQFSAELGKIFSVNIKLTEKCIVQGTETTVLAEKQIFFFFRNMDVFESMLLYAIFYAINAIFKKWNVDSNGHFKMTFFKKWNDIQNVSFDPNENFFWFLI